jgi:Protein of unknown function (DUF5818)
MLHLFNLRSPQSLSALFLAATLVSNVSVVQASSPQTTRVQVQNHSQDQPAIGIFKGKILSQNGEQFILKDDVNETWYHLDDQLQAKKFLGKKVTVTGVLDQSTDTIRVHSIFEPSA